MSQTFLIGAYSVTYAQALGAAAGVIALLLLALVIGLARSRGLRLRERAEAGERQQELEQRMAELARASAELGGRMQSMAETLGSRQADLARVMADRLDNVSARVGAGIEQAAQTTGANLSKLNERLAVIDAAQGRLATLSQEVVSLKDILSNKQARGAFGQGRMEAIVRDGLPASAYDFQYTLSNKSRPDCVIRLPGDERLMAVDAKFPLEPSACSRTRVPTRRAKSLSHACAPM
jgi:DNA recombination protein RmuC